MSTAHLLNSGSSSEDDSGNEVITSDESDFDLELEAQSDDELDFVSTYNTTVDSALDSDEPLSVHVTKTWNSNAPGTPDFRWRRAENVPRKHSFSGCPGVKVALNEDSTSLDIYQEFMTEELISYIVEETNRYVELIHIALSIVLVYSK